MKVTIFTRNGHPFELPLARPPLRDHTDVLEKIAGYDAGLRTRALRICGAARREDQYRNGGSVMRVPAFVCTLRTWRGSITRGIGKCTYTDLRDQKFVPLVVKA